MARPRKPQEVGKFVHDETETEVPIMLDRETFQFYATIEGRKFQHDSKEGLEGILYGALATWKGYEWIPVIQVKHSGSGTGETIPYASAVSDGLTVSIRRFYYAERVGGGLVYVDWTYDESERSERARQFLHWAHLLKHPFTVPGEISGYQIDYSLHGSYLPYDEGLWMGLVTLVGRIGEARNQLNEMLTSKEGQKLLATAGANLLMLPAPA